MGQVKDIYFHQTQGGDEFVGRCVAMLNMMNGDFAVSPAFFDDDVDAVWLQNTINDVFPQFRSVVGMDRVLRMCLASLIHHRDEVTAFAPSHIARRNIPIFCDPSRIACAIEKVKLVHAWESRELHLTGVPPHVKELVDLDALRRESLEVADKVYEKVMTGLKEYLESRGIGGGELTEARIRDMIASATGKYFERLEKKLDNLNINKDGPNRASHQDTIERDNAQEVERYALRADGLGQLTRIPADFEFSTSNTYNCWVQWNVGNRAQSIPPIRLMDPCEFNFLNFKEKTAQEKRGLRENFKTKRRPSRKIYSDMKFICKYIETKASEALLDTSDRNLANVRRMFEAAGLESVATKNRRGDQLGWSTIIKKLRNKLKDQERKDHRSRHNYIF
jgi:hypothetical protein